jgi:hypothetical protein
LGHHNFEIAGDERRNKISEYWRARIPQDKKKDTDVLSTQGTSQFYIYEGRVNLSSRILKEEKFRFLSLSFCQEEGKTLVFSKM